MPLEHRVDAQFLAALHTDETIARFIRPVQTQRRRVRDEEVFKGDFGVVLDHSVAHARPGDVVDPGRVRGEELAGARRDPVREAVVGFLRRGDFPAHDEEHDVQHGDLFGDGAEVRKGAQDVGEDFA